jgi:hypothetical protein
MEEFDIKKEIEYQNRRRKNLQQELKDCEDYVIKFNRKLRTMKAKTNMLVEQRKATVPPSSSQDDYDEQGDTSLTEVSESVVEKLLVTDNTAASNSSTTEEAMD